MKSTFFRGFGLVLLALTGLACFGLYQCRQAGEHTVDAVRQAFVEVFQVQPRVTIDQRVILAQTAPIAELAVVSKEELISLGIDEEFALWSYPVPGTSKSVRAEATYRVKAGFDLAQPFSVVIDSATGQVRASLPPAKILSVEQIGQLKLTGQEGAFNRITDENRAEVLRHLVELARSAAEDSTLKREAEKAVTERLQSLLRRNGSREIEIDWQENQALKQPKG